MARAALDQGFVWGVEQTYCTPYLLSLGLTKSKTSLVWIAGPLSGLIVQPIVGTLADRSTSRWGRRKPFIVVGAVISALFLLLLGFTEDIVRFFVEDRKSAQHLTISAAVLAIYAVDFSINAVMSAAKSLVVDTLPIEKQQTGSAWVSRMSAIGHGIAFATGAIDLPSLLGKSLGETQFKQLTVLAALGLVGTCSVSCWAVTERVLLSTSSRSNQEGGLRQVASHIWSTVMNLPPRIRAICMAQFWAWIGWFPFLFYSTTWIGETYFRYDAPHDAKQSKDALGEVGRVGSKAFIIYSLITFFGSWFLPLVIKSPDDENYTQRPPESIKGIVEKFNKYKPDLLTAWMWAHATFATAMLFAPFARSFKFAAALVCICGLPWNIASWAPHAFLGIEVNKLSGGEGGSYRRLSNASVEMGDMKGSLPNKSPVHLEHGGSPTKSSSAGEPSGVYFGILNIYTTIPQFIGTIISTIVFSILEPGKSPELAHSAHPDEHHGTDGPNGVAAPVAPSKRRSLRAKLAAKAGAEPHAPRKAPRPDAVAPTIDGFTSSKKDKRIIKRSAFMSRVEKTHQKPLKRRRPSKKLVANLESLADALPDLLAEGETEEGLRQLREGKIRHKSIKMRKGALKKKEKIVKGEMDRFSHSLARLNAMGAADAGADMQVESQGRAVDEQTQTQSETQAQAPAPTASTAGRWAALRGFISSTMEQNPAFVGKQK
ncbi:ribosome biogenesis protein SLX9-domain-containing protein [Nemania abortiva]|nr:ribosome biogenesis protein SLX9-domain-containing protein [Nemania abortiva]